MAADSVNFKINIEVDPGRAVTGSKQVGDNLKAAESAAEGLEKTLKKAFEAFVSFEAAKKFLEFAEAADEVDNTLRGLVKDEEELISTVEKLRVISNEGGASLQTSAKAFRDLTLASKEYGFSQEQTLNLLRNVELGLRASGQSADELQGAMSSLTLALSQGEVSGRALRTIFTQLPSVADALSQKLGVTRSGLKELGTEGKISAQDLLGALQNLDPATQRLAEANGGLSAALNVVKNDFVISAGEIAKNSNLTANLTFILKNLGDAVLFVSRAFGELEISVDRYTQKTQKLNESEAQFNSVGAAIQAANRELKNLENRQVLSPAAIDRISQLRAQLDSLQGKAREINKIAEPKAAAGSTEATGAGETQQLVQQKQLLNAEDVKRQKIVEDLTHKLEDQEAAQRLLFNGDRAGVELNSLLSAQRDKQKKDLSDLNTEQTARLLLIVREKQALEDQAKAYQSIVGPAQEYERTQAALVELAKKHPELLAQVNQKLEENRLKFLETQKDLGSGFERAFLKMKTEAEDFAAVAEKAVNSFADEATNAINKFVETGKFDLAGFADAFIADLEKIAARALIVAAITALIPGLAPAAGVGALAGAHASGGTEQPGQSYLVGENGPEIHTPGTTGSTAPISQGDSKPITVQVVNVTHPDEVPNAINGGMADSAIINVLARNPNKAKKILGIQ